MFFNFMGLMHRARSCSPSGYREPRSSPLWPNCLRAESAWKPAAVLITGPVSCIQLGHDVKMMAPQHVKPYVHGNKTDRRDAQAICEAASRPSVKAVPVSSVLQQDIQTLHRVRQQCLKSRTALVNQRRGLLAEYGIVVPKGIQQVRKRVGRMLTEPGSGLTELCREVLQDVYHRVLCPRCQDDCLHRPPGAIMSAD